MLIERLPQILFMGFCLEPRPALVTELMQRGSLFKVQTIPQAACCVC